MISRWSRRSFLGAASSSSMTLLGSAPAYAGGLLQAQGNKLFYSGRQVRLRGVAVGDPLLTRPQRPTGDFRILARTWHCNLVRISVHPGTWRDRQAEAMAALERGRHGGARQSHVGDHRLACDRLARRIQPGPALRRQLELGSLVLAGGCGAL